MILSYPEAAALVLQASQRLAAGAPRPIEQLPLQKSLHRVLAAPIAADRDLPPFPRSTRDGYAVQAAALNRAEWMPVAGLLRAGEAPPATPLPANAALEIMTGAPVPLGADAVVMLEHVELADGRIRLQPGRFLHSGSHIVPAGSEARAGDLLLAPGTRLAPAHMGALAAVGAAQLPVYTRPRAAIVATGDELVEIDSTPELYHIRNSNTASLAAQVTLAGGWPVPLGIARDHLDDLRARLDGALQSSDLLLLSGGVSAGKYDLVEQALAERGAVFHFTGARIQPGKPIVFGELPREHAPPLPFFGLPGNPVSTLVTFLLFAAPMLRALAGESSIAPRFGQASLAAPEPAVGLTRFLPARLDSDWNRVTVERIPWQGSGDLAATAQSSCFLVLPPDTALAAGATVQILLP